MEQINKLIEWITGKHKLSIINYPLSILLLVTALTACNHDNNENDVPQAAKFITIDAAVGAQTRATATAFEPGDRVSIYAWTGSPDAVPAQRVADNAVNTLDADGTRWTATTQMLWKDATTPHYFLGIYPSKAVTDFTADTYTEATDLLVATALGEGRKATDGNGLVPLMFHHVMARLDVNLTFRTQFGGTPTVQSVTVEALPGAVVNYLTKTATAAGTAGSVAMTATAAPTAYTRTLAPQSIRTVTITIGGKAYVYTHPTDFTLVAGKIQTMNLFVGRDAITLGSVSVEDWTTGTDIPGEEADQILPFSDPAFVQVLKDTHKVPTTADGKIDTKDEATLQKLAGIRTLYVNGRSIRSLAGIEYLTGLTQLNCFDNSLTTLDVSKNIALTYLNCFNNSLTKLDVSKNIALTDLDCSKNSLTTLDVSKNTALTDLYCGDNPLGTLDVSNNTALMRFGCYNNSLATLDVSENTKLEWLDCFSNSLTTLDIANNTALTNLYCYDNFLTTLDITPITAEMNVVTCGKQKDNKTITLKLTQAQRDGVWEKYKNRDDNVRVTLETKNP